MNINYFFSKAAIRCLWASAAIFSHVVYSQSVISAAINTNSDDIEEYRDSKILQEGSSDLEMVSEGEEQLIGLRFNKVALPPKAVITKAYIQFKADEANSEPTTLIIKAEASSNASTFDTLHKVSHRSLLEDSVMWSNVPAWVVDARTAAQQSPDLKNLVQALVNQQSWARNNAMAFVISGSGKRVADAYDEAGANTRAAELVVEYWVPLTVQVPINMATDDLEEYVTGNVGTFDAGSSDLEMTTEGKGQQIIGLRFNNINIPKGASLNSAKIQFKADESNTEPTTLVIRAVDVSNTGTFSETDKISTRILTADSVVWDNIAPWTAEDRTQAQLTPDLKTLVSTVINRAGWAANDALAFVINGSGKRVADAFDEGGTSTSAAELIIEYLGVDPNNIPVKPKYVIGSFPFTKVASWKYNQSGQKLPENWAARKFLSDTAWEFGPAKIGFGLTLLGTVL
ncbi:MAG TPA: hypothetical protein VL947_13410, partial [Cytophagales bacterium]|nr:hypothetical protein [Cytophagales bacterium]